MTSRLSPIAESLRSGNPASPVTGRTFLTWYDARRRGPNIVSRIRKDLQDHGLETVPDFESSWIDGEINFRLVGSDENISDHVTFSDSTESNIIHAVIENVSAEEIIPRAASWTNLEATYRVSKLRAANQAVVSVKPDSTLQEITTVMMSRRFSQVPVMSNERDVKGVVSWSSIGARLSCAGKSDSMTARDFMDNANEIRSNGSLFEAIPIIIERDYVLVRGSDQKISGIITASDLSLQFQEMTEPFLLLHEIENTIRNIVGPRFDLADLIAATSGMRDNRTIQNVVDLTFGEYIRLLEKPENWAKLNVGLDRVLFCRDLDKVREIRNDVLHFDPDGIAGDDLRLLREFGQFLRQIDGLLPTQ